MMGDAAPTGPPEPSGTPEMQRIFPISRIGEGLRAEVEANPAERVALSRRMRLLAIHALHCRFDLRRDVGDAIDAQGFLRARVRQTCVVSLEPFDADIAETFSVRFVPAGTESDALDLDAADEIGYEGGALDLGEATSEQLALALDPFPRKPGAELSAELPEEAHGAFAALKINASLALIGAIVAEFFGTPVHGIGFRISAEIGHLALDRVWAAILIAALVGSISYALLAAAERAATFWHPSQLTGRTRAKP